MREIPEFEIKVEPGQKLASNGEASVLLMGDGTMFKRNAIKKAGTPEAYKEQWLVAEIDGVRCYVRRIDGQLGVVLTKQDLYP